MTEKEKKLFLAPTKNLFRKGRKKYKEVTGKRYVNTFMPINFNIWMEWKNSWKFLI